MNIRVVDHFLATQYFDGFWNTVGRHLDKSKSVETGLDRVKVFLQTINGEKRLIATQNVIETIRLFDSAVSIAEFPNTLNALAEQLSDTPIWAVAFDPHAQSLIATQMIREGDQAIPEPPIQIVYDRDAAPKLGEAAIDLRFLPFSESQKQLLYLIGHAEVNKSILFAV